MLTLALVKLQNQFNSLVALTRKTTNKAYYKSSFLLFVLSFVRETADKHQSQCNRSSKSVWLEKLSGGSEL